MSTPTPTLVVRSEPALQMDELFVVDLPRRTQRDVFVDVVRAWGTLVVVTAHWIMADVAREGDRLVVGNTLTHGHGWIATWIFQVIPLMFFASGAAVTHQLASRPQSWWQFMTARTRRLAVPVLIFLAVWQLIPPVGRVAGLPEQALDTASRIAPQLLWFVGVQVILLLLTEPLRIAWRRWGIWTVVGLGSVAAIADVARFTTDSPLPWLNLVSVWAIPYVLGFAYANDSLSSIPKQTWTMLGTFSLSALGLLVVFGPYPLSMVGMPGDGFSNMAPPTLCLVALTGVQLAAAMLLRPLLVLWATRRGPAKVLTWISARSMTIYLWHLSALFVTIALALVVLEIDLPGPWTATWLATRPLWYAASLVVLGLLIRVFARYETGARRPRNCVSQYDQDRPALPSNPRN